MTEALNRAPTGDSARGPGVDETPGPHPLTRRRPESSTSAHATSQASWFRFPRFSKSADSGSRMVLLGWPVDETKVSRHLVVYGSRAIDAVPTEDDLAGIYVSLRQRLRPEEPGH